MLVVSMKWGFGGCGKDGGGDCGVMAGTLLYPRLSMGARRASVMDREVLGFMIRIRIG